MGLLRLCIIAASLQFGTQICLSKRAKSHSALGFFDSLLFSPVANIAERLRAIESEEIPEIESHIAEDDNMGEDQSMQQLLGSMKVRFQQVVPLFRQVVSLLSDGDPNFRGQILENEQADAFTGLHMADLTASLNNLRLMLQQAHAAAGRLFFYHDKIFKDEEEQENAHDIPDAGKRMMVALSECYEAATDIQRESFSIFQHRLAPDPEVEEPEVEKPEGKKPSEMPLTQHFVLRVLLPMGENVYGLRQQIASNRRNRATAENIDRFSAATRDLLRQHAEAHDAFRNTALDTLRQIMHIGKSVLRHKQDGHPDSRRLQAVAFYFPNSAIPAYVSEAVNSMLFAPADALRESQMKLTALAGNRHTPENPFPIVSGNGTETEEKKPKPGFLLRRSLMAATPVEKAEKHQKRHIEQEKAKEHDKNHREEEKAKHHGEHHGKEENGKHHGEHHGKEEKAKHHGEHHGKEEKGKHHGEHHSVDEKAKHHGEHHGKEEKAKHHDKHLSLPAAVNNWLQIDTSIIPMLAHVKEQLNEAARDLRYLEHQAARLLGSKDANRTEVIASEQPPPHKEGKHSEGEEKETAEHVKELEELLNSIKASRKQTGDSLQRLVVEGVVSVPPVDLMNLAMRLKGLEQAISSLVDAGGEEERPHGEKEKQQKLMEAFTLMRKLEREMEALQRQKPTKKQEEREEVEHDSVKESRGSKAGIAIHA